MCRNHLNTFESHIQIVKALHHAEVTYFFLHHMVHLPEVREVLVEKLPDNFQKLSGVA